MIETGRTLASNTAFHVFLLLIVADFISGNAKAFIWGVVNSKIGFKGALKHSLAICLVIVVWLVATEFGLPEIGVLVNSFYIMTYAISFLENLALCGVPVPKALLNRVKTEKAKFEKMLEEFKEEEK
ncbi:phage holin family protein [Herbiconiux daphne]|uniref:Phage holin family protein n=1 Tax=Herbiconiux daphne TaxID=2970914 RepID=A0ABT2HBI4_9MICO|nr:phage holin family protein [Herbiconiux daphne]MCS5737258.1 phage holin family protein [Herbiconiux daphne]